MDRCRFCSIDLEGAQTHDDGHGHGHVHHHDHHEGLGWITNTGPAKESVSSLFYL